MEKQVEKYNAFGKDKSVAEQPLYHMNCAETLLRAANDKYDLNLNDDCYKMLQGFGAGFYSGKTCGAFSGSLTALGLLYGEKRPSDQAKIAKAAKFLVKEFEDEFGSLNCDYIKEYHRDPVTACNPVKIRAAQVFNRVVETMQKENN